MSSPPQSMASPTSMSHRKTASLPVRRRSSAHSENRSRSSSCNILTPQSSVPSEAVDDQYLSPFRTSSSRGSYRLGQSGISKQAEEHGTAFTFRSLHNVTPRPSSPEPEKELATLSCTNGNGFSASALPLLPEVYQELPQPLHTLYSDEKIVIDRRDDGQHVADKQYNVRDERCPEKPFFDPVFKDALQEGLDIAKYTTTTLEKVANSSEPQSDLSRLIDIAKSLSSFESSDTRTIGILGDSGDGKSSLISSLLHFPGIARTACMGVACTSVVTEYRHKAKDHTALITIEAEYLSPPEIEELIKELLWNYRQIYLDEITEPTVSARDYVRIEKESEQAWSALEAAFKDQSSFSQEFLQDKSDGAFDRITKDLIGWTKQLDWPAGGSNGKWRSTASTADECSKKTSIFMSDKFWPFTKIIRIYLNSQVLKTGIVLADLPGLKDTNLARVRATQTYLMKCDHVFIVADIKRAITNHSLKSSIYEAVSRHARYEWEESGGARLKVSVVCTMSDLMDEKTARESLCGPNKPVSLIEMEQLDKAIDKAVAGREWNLVESLRHEQRVLLMPARNQYVKERLQEAYTEKFPEQKLEVFCVSNTFYATYCEQGNIAMVKASGIPDLRRFCHSITADAQLLEAKHFLQSRLSSLLSSIDIWKENLSRPPRADNADTTNWLYDVLEAIRAEASKYIEQSRQGLKHQFREIFGELLRVQRSDWEKEAESQGLKWCDTKKWLWMQYNAWCLNDGEHKTLNKSYVNWNANLIWKMRTEVEIQWPVVEDEIPDTLDKLSKAISNLLLVFGSLIQQHELSNAFSEGIRFRIEDIKYAFGLARQDLQRELKDIRRRGSEPNKSSYVVSEMIPAYRAARQVTGTGKGERQRAIVQGRITNGTLFRNISRMIEESVNSSVDSCFSGLHDKLSSTLGHIKDDLDMALLSAVRDASESQTEVPDGPKHELIIDTEKLRKRHEELLRRIRNIEQQ